MIKFFKIVLKKKNFMVVKIEFFKDYKESTLPIVRLTKSRNKICLLNEVTLKKALTNKVLIE